MMSIAEKEWISAKEVRERLSIGKSKCYEILDAGEIEVIRIGRVLRVNRKSLERWIQAQSGR